jgi:hypothetical protein
MDLDVHRDELRAALGAIGDRALPAPSFDLLVEVPVIRHESVDRSRARLAVLAAAAIIIVMAAGLVWRITSDGRMVTTAPADERWIAVLLSVPDGLALDRAGTNEVPTSVPGFDGLSDETAVSAWSGTSGSMVVVSSPPLQTLRPVAGQPVEFGDGQVGWAVEDGNGLVRLGWIDDRSGAAVGIEATGFGLDAVTAIATSIWWVTPQIWAEVTDHAGFESSRQMSAGFDRWQPDGSDLRNADVGVVGSLQTGFWLGFAIGTGRSQSVGPGLPTNLCWGDSTASDVEPRPWLLMGDPMVTAFVVTDPTDGTRTTLGAFEHPGLPMFRFAVTTDRNGTGDLRVDCERR